jgi:hypothetical protein
MGKRSVAVDRVRTLDAREWPGLGLLAAGWEGEVDTETARAMVASGYATFAGGAVEIASSAVTEEK